MKRPIYIIKIGGSVLTDKSKSRGAFRRNVTRRIIREIVEVKKRKNFDFVLVHGAGAYAHYLTTKYKIADGLKNEQSAWGFAQIKQELFRLNNLLWQECLRAGLAVCTIQPSAVIFTVGGEIKSFDLRLLKSLLEMEIVPLLGGDDTVDSQRGISVLSGDKIVAYLGKKLGAKKIIFVSDVEGVFDKTPKVYKDARLIKEINNKNFESVINSIEIYNKKDASGEMKGKLLAIKENLSGMKVKIINGLTKSVLREALFEKSVGTDVRV